MNHSESNFVLLQNEINTYLPVILGITQINPSVLLQRHSSYIFKLITSWRVAPQMPADTLCWQSMAWPAIPVSFRSSLATLNYCTSALKVTCSLEGGGGRTRGCWPDMVFKWHWQGSWRQERLLRRGYVNVSPENNLLQSKWLINIWSRDRLSSRAAGLIFSVWRVSIERETAGFEFYLLSFFFFLYSDINKLADRITVSDLW